MAIGRYLTDAINQSITNERMSMRDRFSQELQQRRYDEANAYRDKSFTESVRQFQLGHALRQAADKRAGEAHDFLYGPGGYMTEKRGWERDRAQQLEDIHEFNYGPGGYMAEKRGWERDRAQQLEDVHNFMYDPKTGYMPKKMEWEEDAHNFLYGDNGYKALQSTLLGKQIEKIGKEVENYDKIDPYKQKMMDYYDYLMGRGTGGSNDNALLGAPGQSVSTTETLLNREMTRYAQELSEMLEHEDSTWWDVGKVAATTGTGAGLGTIIPGIGNLLGAGVGAGVGLIGGLIWSNDPLMSKDEALTTFSQVGNRIRAQLKREHPGATEAEINKRMVANWNALLNVRKGTGADADTKIGDRLREKIGRLSGGGMASIYTEETLRRAFINGTVPNTQQTAPTDIENAVRQQWNKTHLPPNNPLQIINHPRHQ